MVKSKNKITRRKFIASSTVAVTAISGFPFVHTSHAQNVKLLKIGVIGCGGRGTGAAANALSAAPDIHLIALADPFKDRIDRCLKTLTDPKRRGGPLKGVEVKEDHIFTGMDCAEKLLETDIDIVILTSPPGFRPHNLELAIEAGKHVFAEKPIATDPVGVRKAIATAKKAKEKGLSVLVGLNYRHDTNHRETVKRIHDGMIGKILSARIYRNGGSLWYRGDDPSWSEMEYQCRNWYYFCWLSGDQITEQTIHHLDLVNRVMGGFPVKALGVGGRQVRTDPKYGNIYDHMAIDYEYPNGAHLMLMNRQIKGCDNRASQVIVGTLGESNAGGENKGTISGKNNWEFEDKNDDLYVHEHTKLIDSIRKGDPLNDVLDYAAYSTLSAIMGRESAYTGKVVTWEEILNSDLDLFPKRLEFGPVRKRPVAMPGQQRTI